MNHKELVTGLIVGGILAIICTGLYYHYLIVKLEEKNRILEGLSRQSPTLAPASAPTDAELRPMFFAYSVSAPLIFTLR